MNRPKQGQLLGTIYLKQSGNGVFAPDFRNAENAASARLMGISESDRLQVEGDSLATAMHGDTVMAQAAPDQPQKWWKNVPEKREILARIQAGEQAPLAAKVLRVVTRKQELVVGIFTRKSKQRDGQKVDGRAYVKPDDALIPIVEITAEIDPKLHVKPGDKVLAQITEYPKPGFEARGKVIRRIGRPGEQGVDVLGIIYKYKLPQEFPEDVIKEAESVPTVVTADMLGDREDWRDREVITIDPFDARDFDDAIALTPLPNGGWELAVHIADVSHYVTPGTALEREARERGNSVYLADRVIPMLPERLSNGVCSLRPDEDRLTRAAIMTYDAEGNRTSSRFAKAVIRSKRRYSYEEAHEVMKPYLSKPESALKDPNAPLPARAWVLGSKLRKLRFANGALDLDFPEVKVVLDAKGNPVRLARIEHDESHQLIEEFMLQANEAVAEQMRRAGRPSLFRIHEDPDPDKLLDLRELLGSNGIRVGDLTQRRELQKALNKIDAMPESGVLKLAVLKSLKRAAYSVDPIGHYGLAKENYLHFTSPIRRYADLIVHRVQANLLWGAKYPTPDYGKLQEIADHLGITERNAAEAEIQSRKIKELAYFEKEIRDGKPVKLQATVTQVRRIGLFVELMEIMTRGIVKAEDMGNRPYFFDGKLEQYICRKPRDVIKSGTVIDVIPIYVEQDRGTVGFRLA